MCGQNHLSRFQAVYQPGSGVALPANCPKAMREKRFELLRLSAVASKTTVATITPLSLLSQFSRFEWQGFHQPPLQYSAFEQ